MFEISLEWFGAVAGVTGTALIASNSQVSKWAWPIWCVSSVSVTLVTFAAGLHGVACQQAIYTAFNLWGVWRWIVLPRRVEAHTI